MAKRTAIIDLGSNGVRMAVYERTSRFGFYILHEQKVKFRLSKNASPSGEIANEQIERLVQIIEYFQQIANSLKVRKFLAIGTSAIRDASNQNHIKKTIQERCKIGIKILSGELEAQLGGFGAINLLYDIPRAVCLDIGGGSAELSLCEDGRIVRTCSLDIGTVRLKELYESDFKACDNLIAQALEQIPQEFACAQLISIGGSLRAISAAIMENTSYPLTNVHGFSYKYKDHEAFIKQLYKGGALDGIKKERFDTIRVGALVYARIAAHLGIKHIITSGAGVREGVFLKSILGRHSRLPQGFNPSLKSLEDRFAKHSSSGAYNNAKRMFNALAPLHFLKPNSLDDLLMAVRAAHIGKHISFYSKHRHSAYIVRAGLNFCIRHEQKALISTIIELHGKKFDISKLALKDLLPDEMTLMWLNFILAFCRLLCIDKELCGFELDGQTLHVSKRSANALCMERLRKIHYPKWLKITLNGVDIEEE